MENVITGGAVRAKRGNGKRAGILAISLKRVESPTSQTENDTHDLDVKLEILYQALRNYNEAGGNVSVADMRPRFGCVAIWLGGVAMDKQSENEGDSNAVSISG